jgi:hypothetical protein
MELENQWKTEAGFIFSWSKVLASLLSGFISGCAPGIARSGYHLPPGEATKDLPKHPIAIRCDWKYDTNDVVVLGSIHAYDNGFSTHCDEAAILDIFCREGCMVGADVINITDEHQPNPWTSTCYRANATFIRLKDRTCATNLVSDAKYAPEEVAKRVAATNKRNNEILAGVVIGGVGGGVVGGLVAGAVVTTVTDTNSSPANTNYTKVVAPKYAKP